MQPSDARLLDGLRATVTKLAAGLDRPELIEHASVIDILLGEVARRQNVARLRELVTNGRALLARAGVGEDDAVTHTLDAVCGEARWNDALGVVTTELARRMPTLAGDPALSAEIVAWEAAMFADAVPKPAANPPAENFRIDADSLAAYLGERWPGVRVTAFRRLPGGYSKVTILFETDDPANGAQALVIRAEQPGTPFFMDGADIANEFPALRYVAANGVPVATPLWLEEDASRFGQRFFVTTHAPGINQGDVFGGEALEEATIRSLVETLAALHRTPLDRADPDFAHSHFGKWAARATVAEHAPAFVDYWESIAARCHCASPSVARGFAWLKANPPTGNEATVLVHGDFGLHNVLLKDGLVSAILDWEASHVGDPADEFFLFSMVMSRFVDRPTLLRWYAEAGGQPISPYRLAYYDVLNCLKGPIVGYGALELAERHPESDIKTTMIAYKYVALQLGALEPMIAAAEALR